MEEEEKKICHLQSLLKKELISSIKNKITPTVIKKNNINNYKFDSSIVNHIRYYKNLKKDAKKGLELVIPEGNSDKSQKHKEIEKISILSQKRKQVSFDPECPEGKENEVTFFRQECINEDLKSVNKSQKSVTGVSEHVNKRQKKVDNITERVTNKGEFIQ